MIAHLATAHGIPAREEPAESLATTNVYRLETNGVAAVCLIYLDKGVPAHMRYAIKRLRRKLPKATIILCCWAEGSDPNALEQLRNDTKADLGAASPSEALLLCVREASQSQTLVLSAPSAGVATAL
jgi:hypothetical protein